MIGHNNPPVDPLDAHELAIRDLAELVSGMTAVETQEQADAVEAIAKQCRDAWKAADDARAAEKKPHDDAAKAVQARWKPVLSIADTAKDQAIQLLTPWKLRLAAEARKREQEARERAQALRAEAESALKSDDVFERAGAELDLKEANRAEAAANRLAKTPKGLRTEWTAVFTDRRAALNHYLKTQPQAFIDLLQTLANRDAKGTRPAVPGVQYHPEEIARAA